MIIFSANSSSVVSFQPFPDEIGLPFPLNCNPMLKYSLVALYLLTLIQGTRLRSVIVRYMLSTEANLGPINILISFDQLNGIYLFLTIAGVYLMFQLNLLAFCLP